MYPSQFTQLAVSSCLRLGNGEQPEGCGKVTANAYLLLRVQDCTYGTLQIPVV